MLFPAKEGKRLGRQKQQMSTLTAFQLTIHRSPGANSIQRAETEADSMSLAASIFFMRLVSGPCSALYKEPGYVPCPIGQTMASPMLTWEKLCAPFTGETLALGTGWELQLPSAPGLCQITAWSQTRVLWNHACRWLPLLFFRRSARACLLVCTTWVLALGMFLEHIRSIFSLPVLVNVTIWTQKMVEEELCLISSFTDSGVSSQGPACASFFVCFPSLREVFLPLKASGRNDQSLHPVSLGWCHFSFFSPQARTRFQEVKRGELGDSGERLPSKPQIPSSP